MNSTKEETFISIISDKNIQDKIDNETRKMYRTRNLNEESGPKVGSKRKFQNDEKNTPNKV